MSSVKCTAYPSLWIVTGSNCPVVQCITLWYMWVRALNNYPLHPNVWYVVVVLRYNFRIITLTGGVFLLLPWWYTICLQQSSQCGWNKTTRNPGLISIHCIKDRITSEEEKQGTQGKPISSCRSTRQHSSVLHYVTWQQVGTIYININQYGYVNFLFATWLIWNRRF